MNFPRLTRFELETFFKGKRCKVNFPPLIRFEVEIFLNGKRRTVPSFILGSHEMVIFWGIFFFTIIHCWIWFVCFSISYFRFAIPIIMIPDHQNYTCICHNSSGPTWSTEAVHCQDRNLVQWYHSRCETKISELDSHVELPRTTPLVHGCPLWWRWWGLQCALWNAYRFGLRVIKRI